MATRSKRTSSFLLQGQDSYEVGSRLESLIMNICSRFEDARLPLRQLLGDDLGSRVPPIWGLNQEGELQSVWRELEPAPNLWPVHGSYTVYLCVASDHKYCSCR